MLVPSCNYPFISDLWGCDCCSAQSTSNYFRTSSDIRRNIPESDHRCCIAVYCMRAICPLRQRLLRTDLADIRGNTWCFLGMIRGTIEQLFCFRQATRFSNTFSCSCVPDWSLFFLHLPVSRSSTLMEWLNSYFRVIQLDAEPLETQQIFIRSFPRFLFLSFDHYI
jgi:hypothetical protein